MALTRASSDTLAHHSLSAGVQSMALKTTLPSPETDADFDSYWEDEARNPNRNRIRIGRQYQATVPPLIKTGESDGRELHELETLRWKPDNELTDEQLDQYLSFAKTVNYYYSSRGEKELNESKDCNASKNDSENMRNENSGESYLSIVKKSDNNSDTSSVDSSVQSSYCCLGSEKESELSDYKKTQLNQKPFDNTSLDVKKNCDESKIVSVSGQEVKPLKAKPILPSAIQESNNNVSTVGSLKFYLDGQLVLKLNAQQELTGQKCQWVESSDTAKRLRPLNKASKRLIERHDLEINNHSCVNNDDIEDVSADSSDDDSMESNESSIIPSPSAFIAKKARVKIENSCHIPLASPTSLSVKEQRTDNLNQCNRNLKLENSSAIKIENTSSPTNSTVISDEERKRKNMLQTIEHINDKRNNQSSLENKWYHTIIEKCSVQQQSHHQQPQHPPKAHSSSLIGQMHRIGHSRYESTQMMPSLSSSSSSLSSSSSGSSSAPTSISVPSLSSMSSSLSSFSNAIPVDLTRKSTSCSPLETKSSTPSTSTPNASLLGASYLERDKHSKVHESPSPPRLQFPFVFPYPAFVPHSPIQCQSKIKRDVKSSINMCQKVEGRSLKSPPDSPSPLSITPPLPSQIAWLQNSFVSLPIYEQYYRYYYGYGMPPNSSSGEKVSIQTHKENEGNKDRAKLLSDQLLVDTNEET